MKKNKKLTTLKEKKLYFSKSEHARMVNEILRKKDAYRLNNQFKKEMKNGKL